MTQTCKWQFTLHEAWQAHCFCAKQIEKDFVSTYFKVTFTSFTKPVTNAHWTTFIYVRGLVLGPATINVERVRLVLPRKGRQSLLRRACLSLFCSDSPLSLSLCNGDTGKASLRSRTRVPLPHFGTQGVLMKKTMDSPHPHQCLWPPLEDRDRAVRSQKAQICSSNLPFFAERHIIQLSQTASDPRPCTASRIIIIFLYST